MLITSDSFAAVDTNRPDFIGYFGVPGDLRATSLGVLVPGGLGGLSYLDLGDELASVSLLFSVAK